MQQQNSYLRNNNQPIGNNPYSPYGQQGGQSQPQFSLSVNQPQTSYPNQSQSQLSFQAQGQPSYPQTNLGSSNYVQGNFSQNSPPQNYAQNNSPQKYGQNNYSQNSTGQFNLSLNNPSQNNYSQNNFGQNNTLAPLNPNETGPKGTQPEPNVIPTTSAEIAAYMRKRPYTQMLGGDDFTFSVYPKKQASFIMTHERLLMLKGFEMIAYARQFPANKQLPFASLADVPAPKVSYPLAQVEKADVAEEKLIITFAGPTKVTWEFITANKNSAIEWAQKINAAKQAALSHGAQTNLNFKYDEDVLGRSVYDSPQKPQQTGVNLNLGNNSLSISANSGLNSTPNQSNNIRIEERSNYSYNPNLNTNYGSTYNSNYNQNNYQNLGSNQYSSTYQTGTPERNQNNFSLNAQLSTNPQNYNYQSTSSYNANNNYNNNAYGGNYGSNSNYQPGNVETREAKQHSFSTQGQSVYSQSSNNPSFNVNISSNMARYPLSGQSLVPQQQDLRAYEPSRHF